MLRPAKVPSHAGMLRKAVADLQFFTIRLLSRSMAQSPMQPTPLPVTSNARLFRIPHAVHDSAPDRTR